MKKKLILMTFFVCSFQLLAQKSNVFLRGMVRDSLNLIKDVHVVNLNTLKGTYSNDYGQYRITVSLGDTLEFSSVQFETVKKVITDRVFFSKKLNLILKNKNYVLEEITVKKHNLIGDLRVDRKKVPKDTIALKGKKLSNIIENVSKESQKGILNKPNKIHSELAETSMRNTDPSRAFNGANLMGIVNGIINLIPKKKKKLPQTLSVDQAIKLVEIEGDDFISLRDHAILELFYSSGLRLSELVNLKLEDINFSEEIISVLGKGKKMRIVPVGNKAIQSLQKWINVRAQLKNTNDTSILFLTNKAKSLTQRAIQYRLKFWAKKQGLSENIHPHLLRHSFASHLLQSSQDLRAVQELLGHENISSTQIYTHLDFQHLSKTYDQAHPRAKKQKK